MKNQPENTNGDIQTSRDRGRRKFLSQAGAITASLGTSAALAELLGNNALAQDEVTVQNSHSSYIKPPSNPVSGMVRAKGSFTYRSNTAKTEEQVPIPVHTTNGDETLYATKIGNYSKGLTHSSIGEVNLTDYGLLTTACKSGKSTDFDAIPLGGNVKLVNPQGGLAYDIEGTDSAQLSSVPPPALATATRADEAVELYWQALCRDVPFDQYGLEPLSEGAITELNSLSSFSGPKINGVVTGQSLFRGFTAADIIGPYVSQFLLQPITFGQLSITQQYMTYQPALDYMVDYASWLAAQNGEGPFPANVVSGTVYIRDGRDFASFVSLDFSYQAFLMALLWMINHKTAFNVGNPYVTSTNQSGFATFSGLHISALMAEGVSRAMKAAYYEKWIVHRCLRPEAFGGLVDNTLSGTQVYPLNSEILNSQAVQNVFSANGTYFLPQAFGGGCPAHPSYPQGHATLMGVCATLLKAFFNTSSVFPKPVLASDDGQSLVPYKGSDAGQITLEGELDKLASNLAMARNFAGVHWRSDYVAGLLIGEAAGISVLADQRASYNEVFSGFTFHKFDGTLITV